MNGVWLFFGAAVVFSSEDYYKSVTRDKCLPPVQDKHTSLYIHNEMFKVIKLVKLLPNSPQSFGVPS